MATTDPWPSEAELAAAYAGAYRPATGRFAGPGDRVLRALRSQLARRLDAIAPAGPVLDIGAGDGTLVDALASRGRVAVGVERPEVAASPELRTPNGATIIRAELADLEGAYAAIVFWHSLEHLRRPAEALRRAAKLLVPGGVLVVAVPNADSLQSHAFRERWLALDPPRHLVHISAAALTRLLREENLSVERVSHMRGGQAMFGWLHGIVGFLPGRLNLFDAIRRSEARSRPLTPARRAATLLAASMLAPAAAAATAVEVALRRGGSVYVEARR